MGATNQGQSSSKMNSGKWSYGSYGQSKMTGKGYWGDKKYEQSSGPLHLGCRV